MTIDDAVRVALVAAAKERGLSNRQLTRVMADRFGGAAPSFSKVDRFMRGEHRVGLQDGLMLCEVLDVNLGRLLDEVKAGGGAEYRCILPLETPSTNVQVTGSEPIMLRLLLDTRHAA